MRVALELEEKLLHAVAQQSPALDGVARHAAREIFGRVARRRPFDAGFQVLQDALIVDGDERARLLRHRLRGVVHEPVSERTALTAQRDALHHGRQRGLIEIVDEVPAEDDVGRFGAPRRQQLIGALANAPRIDLAVQRIETVRELGKFRCRLEFVELADGLDSLNGEIDPRRIRQTADALLPPRRTEQTDIVLCWDLINYLRAVQRGTANATTVRVGRPGETGNLVPGPSVDAPTRPAPYFRPGTPSVTPPATTPPPRAP